MSLRAVPPEPQIDRWLYFDIHGLVGMRVQEGAGSAEQLSMMFHPFRVPGPLQADITVLGQPLTLIDASTADLEFRFTSDAIDMTHEGVQIAYRADGIWVHGTRELLTFILPLVDWLMAQRGAAMIHAATFAIDDMGVAMPAWGGVGKTSTIAKLVVDPRVQFFGDDWAFITEGGDLLSYAKPMFIKPHHRPIYPHIFAKKRKVIIPMQLARPLARLTTLVHPFVTRYPRLASLARRWSPEYFLVQAHEALPNARIGVIAPLRLLVFVERYEGRTLDLEERDTRWMVTRLLGNFSWEMSGDSGALVAALAATGLMPLDEAFSRKARVIERAISGRPTYLMRVPASASADEASGMIVRELYALTAASGARNGTA